MAALGSVHAAPTCGSGGVARSVRSRRRRRWFGPPGGLFFKLGPAVLLPVLDGFFVTLQRAAGRALATPAQLSQQAPDVRWMIAHPAQLLDQSGDPRRRPQCGLVAKRLRSAFERLLDCLPVCRTQLGLAPGAPGLFQPGPARLPIISSRTQRITDCRWTPKRRATSAWLTPCCNSLAAAIRRRSKPSKFRFTPAGLPILLSYHMYLYYASLNKCGTESTTGRKFCAACGSPLSRRCPKCGAENTPSSAFCEVCGAALAGNAASAATGSFQAASTDPEIRVTPEQQDPSTTIDGERKTVTALFADIKGSTELMRDLDPEEARAIVDPALKLMIDAAHLYDGYVVQSTGDGIFALFGAPVAHEDHPPRALHAALAM